MMGELYTQVTLDQADYLWIPNTNESTLSKWDARTGQEIARYRVGLESGECVGRCCHNNGCNMPSRIVVDGHGDAYIASRGFAMQGTVSKIAGNARDCVDRDGNGVIDTSAGPMDLRPFGQDECVLWTSNVGPVNAVLRSLAIDRGDESARDGYPWVGSCAFLQPSAINAGLFQLNPRTGAVLRHVSFSRCAYGAVVTPDGRLWEHVYGQGIVPVDVVSGEVGALISPPAARRCTSSYGITADMRGRLWLSGTGCSDVMGYDPALRAWTQMPTITQPRGITGLGVTVDPNGRVWAPIASSPAALVSFDANAFVPHGVIGAAQLSVFSLAEAQLGQFSPSAVGVDRSGIVWLASYDAATPLVRFDPSTRGIQKFMGPNRVYTYTDFTGGIRRLTLGSGTYTETIDTHCQYPRLAELTWRADTPRNTQLTFFLRTAAMREGLATARQIQLATAPGAEMPVDLTARLAAESIASTGQFMRLSVQFSPTGSPPATPTLYSVDLAWRCLVGPG
jgi:sugar lactone lactonase YvrE